MAEPVIVPLHNVEARHLEAFAALIPQLSPSSPLLDHEGLAAIARAESNQLLVAELGGRVVGACLLVSFPTPTGRRALLEDVVVDEASRGTGVGSALVQAAIDAARRAGARTVDLTSRPSREAANRLYARCGFVRRETNVYRYDLRS